MIFEDLEVIWRNDVAQPADAIADEALDRIVMEWAHAYRRRILLRDVSEIGTNAVVLVLTLGVGLWSILRDGGSFPLIAVGLMLTGIGYGFVGAFLAVSRRRQHRREETFDGTIRGNLEKLVANADYQIRLKRGFLWWSLLPTAPGYILITASFAGVGAIMPWIFGGLLCLLFGFILWGNAREVREVLIPRKRELESLLAGLEKDGAQGVAIRPSTAGGNAVCGIRKARIFFGVVGVAICFGLVGWLLWSVAQPPAEPRDPEFDDISAFREGDIAQIDGWLQEQVAHSGFPSLSVVIVRDGRTVYQAALGYENTWTRKVATSNSVYHVASVTKAFTASLAVMLHDRGVIDLDDPVANYLPEDVSISTQPDIGAAITLRQLASHTSGLPRGVPGRVQSVEGRYELEPARLYDLLARVRLAYVPGTDNRYSNLGFGLLGHALERAAGKPLNALLQELLCEPLHLEHTAIHVDDSLPIATGYSSPPQLPEAHSYRQRLAGSGGLVTSVGDLGKFLAAQMKPGLLSRDMLAQLHTETRLADGSGTSRALGWSIDANNPAGRILSKNGGRATCSAWIGFAPDHGIGVAVAANGGTPAVDPIGRWLLERSIPGGSRPASDFGFAKVAPFTGVRWKDDQPIVRVQDQWSPLVSIDGIPIERIMAFAHEEFDSLAHKRFTEDLPELLWKMGHEPAWTVTLGLERPNGQIDHLPARMTTHNRGMARE